MALLSDAAGCPQDEREERVSHCDICPTASAPVTLRTNDAVRSLFFMQRKRIETHQFVFSSPILLFLFSPLLDRHMAGVVTPGEKK